MIKKLTLIATTLMMSLCLASSPPKKTKERPIIVAVIDTGYGSNSNSPDTFLCKTGHKDFTNSSNSYKDNVGHGTNVSNIINDYADDADYCQIILKYYDFTGAAEAMAAAVERAIELNVDVINISGGGLSPLEEEERAIKKALDKGIIVVAAAGNYRTKLDRAKECYYPACYDDRIVVVGALDKDGKRAKFSNYGPLVKVWGLGVDVTSNGSTMTGTSQAAAVITGGIIKGLWIKLKYYSSH